MEIDCVLAIGVDTPEHIALAEQLGYTRAWCYEAPRSYADASMALAVAAERTSRIRLGLVVAGRPRQAETDAAAVDDLASRAPGRADLVVCARDEAGDLDRRAGGEPATDEAAAAVEYLAAVRAAIAAERVGVWTATADGFQAAEDTVAAQEAGIRVVELGHNAGAGLPAELAADRAADLAAALTAAEPYGVLFRPRGPEIGQELAEFAAAAHSHAAAQVA